MLQIESIKEKRFDIHGHIDDAFYCLRNGMVTKNYIVHIVVSACSRGDITVSEMNAYIDMLKV